MGRYRINQTDNTLIDLAPPGSGGGSDITVQDDGTPLATAVETLNFAGQGVTVTGAGATKLVTIPGGSSSGNQFTNQQGLENFITDKAGFRSDIGAGTSDLVIGATPTTALAGDTAISGLSDVTLTSAANDNIIQRKSGIFVNRTPAQLLVDLLTGTGNGVLTNTNGILGTTTLPSPPQTGVNPNPTSGRMPLGQGLNADFVDSTISQTTDTLLTFDATIHHDQGGRDFNIYPTGVLEDFITNPTNYDFSVVTSSTTNGNEGFTEEIFNADITRFNTRVSIINVAAAIAFTQPRIVTIRVGTVVPVASGLANITGLTAWETGSTSVIFTFDTVGNAQAAVTAFSQTQARLTVTSTIDTIQVAAYNANGEGMLTGFLDGRLAEGDRVRFTQRVANLETHLRISTDVVNIDNHLIVDGPTNLNGTVSFGGRITVPEPTDRADAARYLDTWRTAIADSGIRGTTTTQSAGGRTGISVTALSGVENAGPFTNWWIWTGVDLNDAEDGFGIAVENVVYSTSGTDPFATGTSTVNRPINIQATADQSFHRDVDIANDLLVRGDSTVSGDTSIAGLTVSGNASVVGSLTVTEPSNMNHSARWKDTFAGSIHSTGLRGSTTSTTTVGDITGITVTPYTEVEGTTTSDWYHYADVEIEGLLTGTEASLNPAQLTAIANDGRSTTVTLSVSMASGFLLKRVISGETSLPNEWNEVNFVGFQSFNSVDVLVVIDNDNFAHYSVTNPTVTLFTTSSVSSLSGNGVTLISSKGSITGTSATVYRDASTGIDITTGDADAARISGSTLVYAYFRDDTDQLVISVPSTTPTSTFTFYDTNGANPFDLTITAGDYVAAGTTASGIILTSAQATSIRAIGTLDSRAAFGGNPDTYTFTNAQVEAVAGTTALRNDLSDNTADAVNEAMGPVLASTTGKGIFSTNATDPFATSAITVAAFTDIGFPGDVDIAGNIITGSGNSSLTITAPEELYTKVRALATAAVVATANVPGAFSSAALVVSRTLTQGTTSTLYYSVFNTGLTTETLYISTDLTNAIHTKTLQ